jgi:riboflavin-specific deaminase-like protein
VLADNPLLNVRLVEGKNPQPVIVDSQLRFHSMPTCCVSTPGPWIATSDQADRERQRRLEAAGARVLRLPPTSSGFVDLDALLKQLGECGIRSLMVEGGARIITSFLARQLANYLVLTVVPRLVGGVRAVGNLGAFEPARFPGLRHIGSQRLGEDLVLWGDLAWGEANSTCLVFRCAYQVTVQRECIAPPAPGQSWCRPLSRPSAQALSC